MKWKLFLGLLLSEILIILVYFRFSLPPPAPRLQFAPTPLPPSPSPTLTPTVAPLTFTQMDSLYGPCVRLPVLTYHHIQDLAVAKSEGHFTLTVSPDFFTHQLEHIKTHGYNPIKITELINFFNHDQSLPSKPILLTFDDGYDDFFTEAYPILRQYNYPGIVFLPTGLVNNPGYLTWNQVSTLSGSGLVYFASHTWSHQQLAAPPDIISKELTTAATQLSDHGLDPNKVFAYPYGTTSSAAMAQLQNLNYQLAFTTRSGSILCSKQRLSLPRLRIGNFNLSNLGL